MKPEHIKGHSTGPSDDVLPRKTVLAFAGTLGLGLVCWAGIYLIFF